MKVLLISTSSGSTGGGEYYLGQLGSELGKLGHECVIMVNRSVEMDYFVQRFEAEVDIVRHDYKNTYKRPLRVLGALMDRKSQSSWQTRIEQFSPDIVHLNQQTLEDGLDIYKGAMKSNIPLVCTTHVPHRAADLGARSGALRDSLVDRILDSGAQHHICVSPASTTTLAERLPTVSRESRIHTVVNGVSLEFSTSGAADSVPVISKASLGFPADMQLLGNIGRIEAQKNPLFLLQVLNEISNANVGLLWVGDGSMKAECEQYCRDHGLSERVRFTGWVENPADYLNIMDLYCMPSLFEGLPLSLLEAMHAARPVVVSEADGFRDVIHADKGGYILPVRDSTSWSNTIQELLQDKPRRDRYGSYNQQQAFEKYSIRAMTSSTVDVYHKAIYA